jgi:hypothetical protein
MIELTATTITLVAESYGLWQAEVQGAGLGGVYVTASMWQGCASADCVGGEDIVEIVAEPNQWIPLNVLAKNLEHFNEEGGMYNEHLDKTEITQTSTAKLFFPERNLSKKFKYFVTLSFSVEIEADAKFCLDYGWQSIFSKATLGAHIIDAQIIKDGDFGNCNWLNSETDGCGLFDDGDCDGE